jgi:hypothetical protein
MYISTQPADDEGISNHINIYLAGTEQVPSMS